MAHRIVRLLATLLAVTLAGCSAGSSTPTLPAASTGASTGSPAPSASAKPILIGAPLAFSGWLAAYDGPPLEGAKIAIDEVNSHGGVLGRPLQLVTADTKTEIDLVATAGIELLDKKIEFMMASSDFDYGAPAAQQANDRGVVAISPSAASLKFGPEGIGPLAFTMADAAATMGAIDAEWGYQDKGFRNAYGLLDPTIDFEKQAYAAFVERWKQQGGQIAAEDTFQQSDQSIASQVSRIKSAGHTIDVIFVASYNPGVANAIRQIRAAGVDTPILAPDLDGDYWKNAVPNASNLYYPTYGSIYGDEPDPRLAAFYKTYEQKTGSKPVTSQPVTGYSTIEAFKIAAERAGTTDGQKVAAELQKFKDEPLLVGATTFDSKNHLSIMRPMRIMQIQNGTTTFVKMWTPQQVPEVKT